MQTAARPLRKWTHGVETLHGRHHAEALGSIVLTDVLKSCPVEAVAALLCPSLETGMLHAVHMHDTNRCLHDDRPTSIHERCADTEGGSVMSSD